MRDDFNRRRQRDLRRELRADMPLPEVILWSRLKGRQLAGLKFRRQHGIGRFVVDFYCPELRLAIELDGESHFEDAEATRRDAERTAYIGRSGVTILRFTNQQLGVELEGVLAEIARVAEDLREAGAGAGLS